MGGGGHLLSLKTLLYLHFTFLLVRLFVIRGGLACSEVWAFFIALHRRDKIAMTAAQKAGVNEQYSRQNNVKIIGAVEDDEETGDSLTKMCSVSWKPRMALYLKRTKYFALHRIHGKSGMPKPVLLKLENNNGKTEITRKRKVMKLSGHRLVELLQNTNLINNLRAYKDIESVWYSNRNDFARQNGSLDKTERLFLRG